jgi:hypothetical protein
MDTQNTHEAFGHVKAIWIQYELFDEYNNGGLA